MKRKLFERKSFPRSDFLLLGILMLFTFLKGLILYGKLHLGGFDAAFALATAGILAAVWCLIVPFSPKAARIVLFCLYIFTSIVMAVDVVYFSYTSRLPSAVLLGAVGMLSNITDSIMGLVKPQYILLFADLPLWFLYAVNRRQICAMLDRGPLGRPYRWLTEKVSPFFGFAGGAAAALLVLIALIVWPGFEAEYMENEFLCYHTSDLVSSFVVEKVEPVMEKIEPIIAEIIGSDSTQAEEKPSLKSLYTAPDESGSEYFGLAKDRNLIVIQVEALENFVIGATYEGQVITPNLNALIGEDSLYFDHYYYQIGGGNTADAEFAMNNSLFGPEIECAYTKFTDKHYHGLPYLLKDNGYSGAYVFHGYIGSFWNREAAYPNQGFDDFISLEDLEETELFTMGLCDRELYRQAIPHLLSYEQPFYSFFITVSSHFPYGIPLKDRDIALKPEDEQTLFGLYLQAINYTDRAIGEFVEQLKEAGLYENSMIVIYGDHYALSNSDPQICGQFEALTGRRYSLFDQFNVPYIIHIPGMGRTETHGIAGGHIDSLPTMLCLLGIRNDKSVMFGQNLLTAERGFVCEQMHLSIGSFISDEIFFQKPQNNIKTNYSVYAAGTLEKLDPDLFMDQSALAAGRIADCAELIKEDDLLLDGDS